MTHAHGKGKGISLHGGTATVTAKCVGCGKTREIKAGEIAADDVPMCACGMPMVATKATATDKRKYTSTVNDWKQALTGPPLAPKYVFQPLRSWPACPHPRQAEIDQHCRFRSGPRK
jgi:hypothetical protein